MSGLADSSAKSSLGAIEDLKHMVERPAIAPYRINHIEARLV
jgi:hypothetical protein